MGGILGGIYKPIAMAAAGTGAMDEEHRTKVNAAELGELEAKEQGNFEAGKLRELGSQMIARQRTAYANSGVDTTKGTPLSVMADTRLMSETDARMAENNAARKVRGFREQKRQADAELAAKRDQRTQDMVGSLVSGFGSIVGGAVGMGG